jgi:predicted transcriptional regulator
MLLLQHFAMTKKRPDTNLSRRERQMMDILYQKGRATAAEVHELLADPPSYSAVRAKLRVLEEKGHIRHEAKAARYIYSPVVARDRAKESALRHMLATFFDNSAEQAMTALLALKPGKFSREKLDGLSQMIERAKKEGGKS